MSRRVAILLPAADHGDALSHFALLLARTLRELQWQAEVLAPIVHAKMRDTVKRTRRLPDALGDDDRILLVHSTSSPWLEAIESSHAPVTLLYTGITPPELVERDAPHLAAPLRLAQTQLRDLAPRVRGAICTSETAARELAELTDAGVASEVVPLVVDESLYPVHDVDEKRPVGHPPRLLVVGRVVPHKRVEDAVAVHACLRAGFDPDVTLDIVGDDRLCPDYVKRLQALTPVTPDLPAPQWWGKVSFDELIARYRSADVLLFPSAHEGFGVPLLEAMWLGVPIVAAHCEGTAETLGSAGLLVRGRHAAGFAELVEMVLTDGDLRRGVICAGRERARLFARETLRGRLVAAW